MKTPKVAGLCASSGWIVACKDCTSVELFCNKKKRWDQVPWSSLRLSRDRSPRKRGGAARGRVCGSAGLSREDPHALCRSKAKRGPEQSPCRELGAAAPSQPGRPDRALRRRRGRRVTHACGFNPACRPRAASRECRPHRRTAGSLSTGTRASLWPASPSFPPASVSAAEPHGSAPCPHASVSATVTFSHVGTACFQNPASAWYRLVTGLPTSVPRVCTAT